MKYQIIKTIFISSALLASSITSAALIDLSTWQHDGQGAWGTQGVNDDSVYQTSNTPTPTVFFEDGSNARNTAISGEIKVNTSSDDDFVGFVLGYQDNELSSSAADFWLIDWKQISQNYAPYGGASSLGLALSHVTNSSTANFWTHTGNGITETTRGTTLGNIGWTDYATYSFDIIHTASLIEVKVNGNVELSVSAADAGVSEFTDGAYGFYNYSQSNVLYSGITQEVVEAPEPTTLAIFALGLMGLASRRFKKS